MMHGNTVVDQERLVSLDLRLSDSTTCKGNYLWDFNRGNYAHLWDFTGKFTNGKLLCNNGVYFVFLGKSTKNQNEYFLHYSTRTSNDAANTKSRYVTLSQRFGSENGSEYCGKGFHEVITQFLQNPASIDKYSCIGTYPSPTIDDGESDVQSSEDGLPSDGSAPGKDSFSIESDDSDKKNVAAIVGGIVGGVLFCCVIVAAIMFYHLRYEMDSTQDPEAAPMPSKPSSQIPTTKVTKNRLVAVSPVTNNDVEAQNPTQVVSLPQVKHLGIRFTPKSSPPQVSSLKPDSPLVGKLRTGMIINGLCIPGRPLLTEMTSTSLLQILSNTSHVAGRELLVKQSN